VLVAISCNGWSAVQCHPKFEYSSALEKLAGAKPPTVRPDLENETAATRSEPASARLGNSSNSGRTARARNPVMALHEAAAAVQINN